MGQSATAITGNAPVRAAQLEADAIGVTRFPAPCRVLITEGPRSVLALATCSKGE